MADLGGCIFTSCLVFAVSNSNDGKITLSCNYKNAKQDLSVKNVVHAWNGYGPRYKFLPKRLAD